MKLASEIIEWGKLKPYFDKTYQFNTIDIETIDNKLFLLGSIIGGKYSFVTKNFYDVFHRILIKSLQSNCDILTWSRYDNTHLLKLLLEPLLNTNKEDDIRYLLLKVGKISPIYEYRYKSFTIRIDNIIKDSMIFSLKSDYGEKWKRVVIYNLKNLYHTDLETTAKNYSIDFYSKLGVEYHLIDKTRYMTDFDYRNKVILANQLDNKVLIVIANKMLEDFKQITGVYPKSIFTNGSIARSYLLAWSGKQKEWDFKLQFKSNFYKSKKRDKLLDYSMKSYHGGKIESYILGYVKNAKVIDITSAYPYAMSKLPLITGKYKIKKGVQDLDNYFYAFIKCNIIIEDEDLIHPLIIPSPLNKANISPYGYIKDIVITKYEYDYLIKNNVDIKVIDYIGLESDNTIYPYHELVQELFDNRMLHNKTNKSLAEMYKTILNSLYGITFELTDVYEEFEESIEWVGYRAGDYFNPVVASYITAITRTYLSEVSYNIIQNGGKVYLNMTDSIIYDGKCTLDVFSDKKILGKFEAPEEVEDVIILGAGRYEYRNALNKKYTIKSRGFSVSIKDKAFYKDLELNEDLELDHRTFVTAFKATLNAYGYEKMGYLIDDKYKFNPFNLGGKRFIINKNVNLNQEYTKTKPVYLDKSLYDKI